MFFTEISFTGGTGIVDRGRPPPRLRAPAPLRAARTSLTPLPAISPPCLVVLIHVVFEPSLVDRGGVIRRRGRSARAGLGSDDALGDWRSDELRKGRDATGTQTLSRRRRTGHAGSAGSARRPQPGRGGSGPEGGISAPQSTAVGPTWRPGGARAPSPRVLPDRGGGPKPRLWGRTEGPHFLGRARRREGRQRRREDGRLQAA